MKILDALLEKHQVLLLQTQVVLFNGKGFFALITAIQGFYAPAYNF